MQLISGEQLAASPSSPASPTRSVRPAEGGDCPGVQGAVAALPRVHFMRNCLAYVPKGQHNMVAATPPRSAPSSLRKLPPPVLLPGGMSPTSEDQISALCGYVCNSLTPTGG
jgi:hypothetical protein